MNSNSPTSPERPDPFDALLRESEAHIPDDGFTARVLTALPPRRRFDPLRLGLFAAAWLAGAVILLLRAPSVTATAAAFLNHTRHGDLAPLLALAPVVFAVGCLAWALASWALEEWT
jgi:hypothetical protein